MRNIKIIYFILLLVFNINLTANNIQKKGNTLRTFDIERFEKNKDKEGYYRFNLDENTLVEQRLSGKTKFIEKVYDLKSFTYMYYGYFSSGKLEHKHKNFINRFSIGKQYIYNKSGKIIEIIDHDNGYTFDWNNIVKYAKLNGVKFAPKNYYNTIRKEKISSFKTYLKKGSEKEKVFNKYDKLKGKTDLLWVLQYKKDIFRYIVYFDDRQGNIIYIEKRPLSDGRPLYKNGKAYMVDNSESVYQFDEKTGTIENYLKDK